MNAPVYEWESDGSVYGLDENGSLLRRCEDRLENIYWCPPARDAEGIIMGPELLRVVKAARQHLGSRAEAVFEPEEEP